MATFDVREEDNEEMQAALCFEPCVVILTQVVGDPQLLIVEFHEFSPKMSKSRQFMV